LESEKDKRVFFFDLRAQKAIKTVLKWLSFFLIFFTLKYFSENRKGLKTDILSPFFIDKIDCNFIFNSF
jgi:hypothetical protein